MSLQSQIDALCHVTNELLNLGFDGTPLYSNRFCELNTEVYRQSEALFLSHGSTAEEEARLCYALLTGFHATIYDHGDKNQKIQSILNRSWNVLELLSVSLLKCQLLVACYGEIYDEKLAQEAHAIIDTWKDRELSPAELEVSEYLNSLETNPWTAWELDE